MRVASIFAEGHKNNSLFAENDPTHTYAPTHTSRSLRKAFLEIGIELNTADLNEGKDAIFELYVEGQVVQPSNVAKYLVAMENPNINPLNQDLNYCSQFEKVFSWNPAVAALENGVLSMVPNEIRIESFPGFNERPIFACLINANKRFFHSDENDLYIERLRLIRWYEDHDPSNFMLFGRGWDKPGPAFTVSERILRAFKRTRSKLFSYRPFPSYQGEVLNKRAIFRKAKFAYCYENSKNLTNYITEKIFDAMMCGSVPIYLGANNITKYIPENCFVDARYFASTEKLHNYLLSINAKQYEMMQDNIKAFLLGKQIIPFSSEFFVATLFGGIASTFTNLKIRQGV
ncbi:glycosyltransferase family 10 domain-containing protein [Polynucleobacter sp.]|uniref:glycosyltransferase family 10 domain-containing protein n=1 Tax=Polynucleobacter sp. TaxID=2029855 RepID=UPI0027360999|nr:glycosyltransferase family 10 [Polynucleobacter sp.]MDP3122728.1 glycosyltransferase family 10 [Polynucleobacter sp.]